ncbi:MAG: hypothetical protein AAFX93_09190 [Verrucomicrobiota bacterium]
MNPLSNDQLLRRALFGNAVSSSLSGLVMLLFSQTLGSLIGIETSWFLPWIGGALLLFAVDLVHQATRPNLNRVRALGSSIGDFFWVLASIVLLLCCGSFFTPAGVWIISLIAIMVLVFGILQIIGVQRLAVL